MHSLHGNGKGTIRIATDFWDVLLLSYGADAIRDEHEGATATAEDSDTKPIREIAMLYQFKCDECDCQFEVKQSIYEEHRANCPQCGKEAQRIYSSPQWVWTDPFLHWDDKNYREQWRDEANA